jgi:DNA-directed RNA polymerase subunit RPC12/RpoP
MIKYQYFCDKCGKETDRDGLNRLDINTTLGGLNKDSHAISHREIYLCSGCMVIANNFFISETIDEDK